MIEKIKGLLKDNKKRHLVTIIAILPFFIVIGIVGYLVLGEAKNMLGLVSAEKVVVVSPDYSINGTSFVLRENATNIQKDYFIELKTMYEKNSDSTSPEQFAESTVKNFVADFYTWSNKQGQYDVGGTYYLYTPQRQTIYIQARDQFYKYINQYINEYGANVLLEVESVETTSQGSEFEYEVDDQEFNAYNVTANWTYVQKDGSFKTSSYDTKAHFVVIDNNGRFEIVYMGDKEYEEKEYEEDIEDVEETEENQ